MAADDQGEGPREGWRIRKADRPMCEARARTGKPCAVRVLARPDGTLAHPNQPSPRPVGPGELTRTRSGLRIRIRRYLCP